MFMSRTVERPAAFFSIHQCDQRALVGMFAVSSRTTAFPMLEIDEQLRDSSFTPSWLLEQILYGMEYTRLDESSVEFECWCDETRLLSALATLRRADIEELVEGGNVLEITCDYCGKEYRIMPHTLLGLLGSS